MYRTDVLCMSCHVRMSYNVCIKICVMIIMYHLSCIKNNKIRLIIISKSGQGPHDCRILSCKPKLRPGERGAILGPVQTDFDWSECSTCTTQKFWLMCTFEVKKSTTRSACVQRTPSVY